MNAPSLRNRVDPIAAEVLRTRLEAIGQEAGAAVEQTAISPIVTESKDYSVTICDAKGRIVCGSGIVAMHFGAAAHAVRSTIARYGDGIDEGDLFIANDPHSGGGLHAQDVVIQQPVFVDGEVVAWVALAAHMMDMGGMVPGSSAVAATECYQEALRMPPVRLIRRREEVTDVWDIFRTNIRSAAIVEMDMRSLVIGAHVAEAKLTTLIETMGTTAFTGAVDSLIESAERVLRARVSQIEDGRYAATGWVEWGDKLFRLPVGLIVDGDRLIFDLTDAPPQAPHFFNSKPYIIRAVATPLLRMLLAPNVPLNQANYDLVEIESRPGSLVDCVLPAPVAAAHMDAAGAVAAAATYCLQLAIHASPEAWGRQYNTGPEASAYGTARWSYRMADGSRNVLTIIDGAFAGSAGGADRDGIDLHRTLIPAGTNLEYADIEILETAYPLLFDERSSRKGAQGHGRFRSGAGCQESFGPHGIDELLGNMTGTKSWFPSPGAAGGLPGATTRFQVTRSDGAIEPIAIQQTGVSLRPGDRFAMLCASGGGFGDPLDRALPALRGDLDAGQVSQDDAAAIYGVVFAPHGEIDEAATVRNREDCRRQRLLRAAAAAKPAQGDTTLGSDRQPLYPGVVQSGRHAFAEASGALLASAPDSWLDGCPTLDMPVDHGGDLVKRAHLDPGTGRILHLDVVPRDSAPSLRISPVRWTSLSEIA